MVITGYGVYLSEIIMNQAHELPLRQIAIIMLTRYVEHHWTYIEETGKSSGGIASEQAKRTIRNILPNGLYDPNSKIRSSVAHTISTIAATDYPHCWTELFDIIVKCLSGNEDSIHGAMQVLQDFTYDVEQIKELGPVVIPEVYRIFDSEQNYSIKTRVSAIRTLKQLFVSIHSLITDKQEQSTMMNSILTNFMDKLVHYLSMNCGAASSFLLRSEIIKGMPSHPIINTAMVSNLSMCCYSVYLPCNRDAAIHKPVYGTYLTNYLAAPNANS